MQKNQPRPNWFTVVDYERSSCVKAWCSGRHRMKIALHWGRAAVPLKQAQATVYYSYFFYTKLDKTCYSPTDTQLRLPSGVHPPRPGSRPPHLVSRTRLWRRTYFLLNFIDHAYAARERCNLVCCVVFSLTFSTKYRLVLCNISAIAVIRWRIVSNTVAIQIFFREGTLTISWRLREWWDFILSYSQPIRGLGERQKN